MFKTSRVFAIIVASLFIFINSLILNSFLSFKNLYLNIISLVSLIPLILIFIYLNLIYEMPQKGTLQYYVEIINKAKINGANVVNLNINNYEIVNKLQALKFNIIQSKDNKNIYIVYL